jgi:ABC-type multidrug transport system ATPase subunit
MKAIETQNLKKSFGGNHAVQGISFEVEEGEIFSLLGPNGAGKTTTISMLSCLLQPDAGDARVMGHSIRTEAMEVKSVLGVVPQEIALYEDLTAPENRTFWGKMYGLRGSVLKSHVNEVLDVIGLSDRATFRAVGHLSPIAWGMDGFENIIARGLGFTSVLLPAAALIAYVTFFFLHAEWQIRKMNQ